MKIKFLPRFGLRFVLFAFLLLCIGLAWLARLEHLGKVRLLAAETLREYGVIVLESRQAGDIYTGTMTLRSGAAPPWDVDLCSVKPYEEYRDGILRSLIGDAVFAEHTILVFHTAVTQSAEKIQLQINKLPKLETIYINQNEIGRPLIETLEMQNPNIEFRINSIGIHPKAARPAQNAG